MNSSANVPPPSEYALALAERDRCVEFVDDDDHDELSLLAAVAAALPPQPPPPPPPV